MARAIRPGRPSSGNWSKRFAAKTPTGSSKAVFSNWPLRPSRRAWPAWPNVEPGRSGRCRWCCLPPGTPGRTFPGRSPRRPWTTRRSKSSRLRTWGARNRSSSCPSGGSTRPPVTRRWARPATRCCFSSAAAAAMPRPRGEMHEFAQCRAARRPELRCEVAFLAMAEPPLDRALEAVARSRPARCVVQPHLLFAGQLLADVRHKVSQIARQTPQTEWIVTAHLGPDIRLATAVAQLARQKSSPALTKARTKSPGVTS